MSILKKLFGKEKSPSQDAVVETETIVETKVLPKKEDIGVPADGDQVVRGK